MYNVFVCLSNNHQPVAGTNSADGGALGPEFDALLTGIGTPGKLPCASCCASDDVTVVLETCREPELRRPLEAVCIAKESSKKKWQCVNEKVCLECGIMHWHAKETANYDVRSRKSTKSKYTFEIQNERGKKSVSIWIAYVREKKSIHILMRCICIDFVRQSTKFAVSFEIRFDAFIR